MSDKKKRITLKQRVFIQKYLESGNGTQSALEAYDTNDPEVASVIASENLTKPNIKDEIQRVLSSKGLTLQDITSKLGTIANEKDIRPTASDSIRALDILLKLHNAYPTQKTQHTNVNIRTDLNKQDFKDLLNDYNRIDSEIKEVLND